MNIAYILEFIKTQFDGVSNPNSAECGEVLLMISKYLLEQIENEPTVFTASTDARALRRSFLYCSKISRILGNFAGQYSTPIAQIAQQSLSTITENEYKLQEVQQKCEDCETRAETIQIQTKELEKSNNDLLTAQSTLEARQSEYDTLLSKLKTLRRIQISITDERLETLQSEIKLLEPQVIERQTEFADLTEHHKTLSDELSALVNNITTAKENDKKLTAEIQRKTGELEALQKEVSTHIQGITNLTSAIKKAGDEYNELQELIEANNRIANAIQASGYVIDDKSSPDSFFSRVDTLNQQARDLEIEYDQLLKNILKEADALLQSIAQRQEPNYLGGDTH